MAESVIFIREHGLKSVQQLDEYIQKSADERQNLQDKIKVIDKEISSYPIPYCFVIHVFISPFFKQKRRLDFTLITFAIYQILLLYFNFLIDSLSDSIFICSIAIAFNFSNLSDWLMPSFINTALRFSRLERQTSCDISA